MAILQVPQNLRGQIIISLVHLRKSLAFQLDLTQMSMVQYLAKYVLARQKAVIPQFILQLELVLASECM